MTGKVYFIKCGDRIKIGFSKNLPQRLKALSTASAIPIELVASQIGTVRLEKAIHAYLAPHRAQLEWFYDCPHVRAVISEIVLRGGEAIGFQDPGPKVAARTTAPAPVRSAPVPDISDSTLAAINSALSEARAITSEIERNVLRGNHPAPGALARLDYLAGMIGPALFPNCAVKIAPEIVGGNR